MLLPTPLPLPPPELESWVLSASPSSVRLGQGCYADSPEFTGGNAVMEEVASRLTISSDEVGEGACEVLDRL